MSPLEPYLDAHRIAFGPLMFQAARVARDNGLLSAVESASGQGLTPAEAAGRAGCSRYAARVLLESCLSMRLVSLAEGRYRIAPAGRLVLHDPMTRVNMDFVHDVCYRGAYKLEESLKDGRPRGLEVFGPWDTIYEALTQLPSAAQKSWFAFDHFYSDTAFKEVLPVVFARRPRRVLDVGGNTGRWALACATHDPEVEVTLLDHPAQLALALESAAAAGVGARVKGHARDLLDHREPFPGGFDVVWMSQLLDCFPESDILALLGRAREALAPEGRVHVLETFWDLQPNEVARYCVHATSLYFACMANGTSRMYHSEDLRALISEAGLTLEASSQHGYHTLLTCAATRRGEP